MALPAKQQLIWWTLFLVILFLALVVLGDILLPFLIGSAIAYLLDPVADRLQRIGCSRVVATAIIAISALLMIAAALVFLIPLLAQQSVELALFLPELVVALRDFAEPWLEKLSLDLLDEDFDVAAALARFGDLAETIAAGLASQALSIGVGTLNILLFILVVPVVFIYMLADWDHATAKIHDLLPVDHAEELTGLLREVDRTLAGFVRGQLTVCGILGGYYAILLEIAGLPFGLVVGVVSGALSFIPFVGSIGGGALAMGLAIFQFWHDPLWIGVVAVIFLSGQLLEQNFLTPRLVGKSVGLHPVWLLFALSAFGSLFGFVGLLVAVPASAIIGVFLRYGVGRYTSSRLYLGSRWNDEE